MHRSNGFAEYTLEKNSSFFYNILLIFVRQRHIITRRGNSIATDCSDDI